MDPGCASSKDVSWLPPSRRSWCWNAQLLRRAWHILLSEPFALALRARLRDTVSAACDGFVSLCHTEGSVPGALNRELVLRTLAGLVVHPNCGAILLLDYGSGMDDITTDDVLAKCQEIVKEELESMVVHGRLFQLRLGQDFSGTFPPLKLLCEAVCYRFWKKIVEQKSLSATSL